MCVYCCILFKVTVRKWKINLSNFRLFCHNTTYPSIEIFWLKQFKQWTVVFLFIWNKNPDIWVYFFKKSCKNGILHEQRLRIFDLSYIQKQSKRTRRFWPIWPAQLESPRSAKLAPPILQQCSSRRFRFQNSHREEWSEKRWIGLSNLTNFSGNFRRETA